IKRLNSIVATLGLAQKSTVPCSCPGVRLDTFIDFSVRSCLFKEVDYLFAIVYLQRSISLLRQIRRVQRCSQHRFFLAALMTANKVIHDYSFRSVPLARDLLGAFRMSLSQYHKFELEFLALLQWNFSVSEE
ncbi:hypothetical protein B0I35DRAFT_343180, partial [Stachybotrys elegans]